MADKVVRLPDPEQRSRQADAVPCRFAGDGCIVFFPNFAERRRQRDGLTVDQAVAVHGDVFQP